MQNHEQNTNIAVIIVKGSKSQKDINRLKQHTQMKKKKNIMPYKMHISVPRRHL